MEGQNSILKIFLIAAVVCILALGAPMNIETCSKSAIWACSAAKETKKFCSNTTSHISWPLPSYVSQATYSEIAAARALLRILIEHNFWEAVTDAISKCFYDNDGDSRKCKLAAAVIILQDSIKGFISEYEANVQVPTPQISGNATMNEVEVLQTLCNASRITQDLLAKMGNTGTYYHFCYYYTIISLSDG